MTLYKSVWHCIGKGWFADEAVVGGKPLLLSSDKARVEKKIRDNELKNKKVYLQVLACWC